MARTQFRSSTKFVTFSSLDFLSPSGPPGDNDCSRNRYLEHCRKEALGFRRRTGPSCCARQKPNRNQHSAIAAGSFRSDLFYRLNVFPIELPPLRERKEDIPILVNYFVNRYAQRAGKKIDTIRKKSIDALQEYSWPGNVRELQNVIERSLIIVDTNEFSVDKNWLSHEFQSSQRVGPASSISTEQEQIEAALAQTKGKVSGRQGAAAILGLPASTLESKIRTLRINKHAYKGA